MIVIKAQSVNSFKRRLDIFWNDKKVKYNWKADIELLMLLPDTTLACIFRVHIFEMIRQLLTDTIRYCDTFVCYFRQVWVLSVHRIQNRVSVHDAVQPNSEDKRRTEDVSF